MRTRNDMTILVCLTVLFLAAAAGGCGETDESDDAADGEEVIACENNSNTDVDDCPFGACDEQFGEGPCDEKYGDYEELSDEQWCGSGADANYYLEIEKTPDEEGFDRTYLIVDCQDGSAVKTTCDSGVYNDTTDTPRYECN